MDSYRVPIPLKNYQNIFAIAKRKEVAEEKGFPVAISSCDVDVVTVSFLQLKSPKIKMRLDVMINFFIVFVFGGDYNIKNEILVGDKLN